MVDTIIPIDLTGGMKNDSSLKQTTQSELLENVTLDKDGYPKKRNGFTERPFTWDPTRSIPTNVKPAKTLLSFDGRDQIIFENNTAVYDKNREVYVERSGPSPQYKVNYVNLLNSYNFEEIATDQTIDPEERFDRSGLAYPQIEAYQQDNKIYLNYSDRERNAIVLDEDSKASITYEVRDNFTSNEQVVMTRMRAVNGQVAILSIPYEISWDGVQAPTNRLSIKIQKLERPADTQEVTITPQPTYLIGELPNVFLLSLTRVTSDFQTCANGEDLYVIWNAEYGEDYYPGVARFVTFITRINTTGTWTEVNTVQVFDYFNVEVPAGINVYSRPSVAITTNGTSIFATFIYNNIWTFELPLDLSSITTYKAWDTDDFVDISGEVPDYPFSLRKYVQASSLAVDEDGDVFLLTTGINQSSSIAEHAALIRLRYANGNFGGDYKEYMLGANIPLSELTVWNGEVHWVSCYVQSQGNRPITTPSTILSRFNKRNTIGGVGKVDIAAMLNVGDLSTSAYSSYSNYRYNIDSILWGGGQYQLHEKDGKLVIPFAYSNDIYGGGTGVEPLPNQVTGKRSTTFYLIEVEKSPIIKTTFNEDQIGVATYPFSIISERPTMNGFAHSPYWAAASNVNGIIVEGTTPWMAYYVFVYEMFDAKGNIMRSVASNTLTTTFAEGRVNYFTIAPYIFSDSAIHQVAFYRTKKDNPETFYFVKRQEMIPQQSSSPADFATQQAFWLTAIYGLQGFVDDVADDDLGGELYIGQLGAVGELENTIPPVINYSVNHNNRIYGISAQDRRKVFYSKQAIEGRGLEWNDTLSFIIDRDKEGQESGLVALASTENYLICFKKSSIFVVAGDGPNNIGIGETHTLPSLVSDTIGCIDAQSVISVTMGVIFKSYKGWKIITKGLTVVDLDIGVADKQNDKILRAVIHRERNVIMWLTDAAEILCLDMNENDNPIKWTIFTGDVFQNAVDIAYSNGTLKVLRNDGVILDETNLFTDTVNSIDYFVTQKITTGWLRIGDIAEYQRAKRLFITGEYKSSHNLVVDISYDFEDYVSETITLTPEGVYEVTSPPTNNAINTGTNTGVYEWDIHLSRQKCSAIKFTVRDTNDGTLGESFQLEGMAVKIGKKVGLRKINEKKKG